MLKCRELVQETMANPDILTHKPRLGVRVHLLICRHCRRYLRQLRVLLALLPHLHSEDARKPADEQTVSGVWSSIRQAGHR